MAYDKTQVVNTVDKDGNPAGGHVKLPGISIDWQKTPLGIGKDRKEPTGAFVEGVLEAARQRLFFYQGSKFACDENVDAIQYIGLALARLNARTLRRETAGIEGTNREETKKAKK